jgi:hypothetical protein
MAEKESPTPYGPPDPTGYGRPPHFTVPPGWYPQPPPAPAAPKEKSTAEKIKDWIPTVVVVATVIGAIATTWRDWEDIKRNNAANTADIAQLKVGQAATNELATTTQGATLSTAKKVDELNETLKRLNLTGPRRRPRPDPSPTP